jgi:PAS domain S-box-containing protein
MTENNDADAHTRRLERMFDLSLDLLCIAGVDGYFKRVNPSFRRILGYETEELLERQFIEFVHPDDREQTIARVSELAEGRAVIDFRNRYRAKDGAWHWLAWRSSPADEEGLIYAVARDITDEVGAQQLIARQAEDLARSNADLEEFAYAASHDLQAPLRAITHLVDWIRDDAPEALDPKMDRHLDELVAKVRNMQQLVDDLLAYSRVGRRDLEPEVIDVAKMIDAIVDLLSPPEGLEIERSPELPTFRTDVAALHQVFLNLIGNAISHHHRAEGRVTIKAEDRGDEWEFQVTDDGPGIVAEDLDRVFDRFVRLDPQAGSTGMGLALVKKIVEREGGKVWVASDPGTGSTFSFSWPKTTPHTESS